MRGGGDLLPILRCSIIGVTRFGFHCSNLGKLSSSLQTFFDEHLKNAKKLSIIEHVSPSSIAQATNSTDLLKLFEFVLLCAICADPKRVVERIETLDGSFQQELMFTLQFVLTTYDPDALSQDSSANVLYTLLSMSCQISRTLLHSFFISKHNPRCGFVMRVLWCGVSVS